MKHMDVMDKDNKNKLLNLKKLIKVEPNTGQRLQSLRLPRDLSLGGTKLQKKQFAPNVNVTRNKQNIKEIVKKNGFQGKSKNDWDRNKNGTRNKNLGTKYMESSSIFSEGAGNPMNPKRYASDRFNDKDTDGAIAAMAVPTIKKNSYEIDKENENHVLDKLEGYEDAKDEEKYPFQPIIWQKGSSKEIKQEINSIIIKKEEIGDSLVTPEFREMKLEPPEHSSANYAVGEYFEEDYVNNDKPSISLWSLPDSFAGKGLSDDPNCTKLFDYCLNDMLEGKIGKLVIRKSGKIEVHIGQVKYNLEPGDIEAYAEKIVSMETKKLQHAAVLGQIGNRYFLHPDWDSLFS